MVTEPTRLPKRVDLEDVRLLLERRKAGKMTGVWLSIEDVESMLIECELYRLKHDASYRRQKDATTAQRKARQKWDPIKYDD